MAKPNTQGLQTGTHGRSLSALIAILGLLIGLSIAYLNSPGMAQNVGLELLPTELAPEPKNIHDAFNTLPFEEVTPIWHAYQNRYQQAVALHSADPLSGLFTPLLDTAFLSQDGQTAILWLALQDPSGERLHTEPGLAIAVQTEEVWKIILPADPEWKELLGSMPEEAIPAAFQKPAIQSTENEPMAPITGYYLPFAAGTSRQLEGSVLHFHSYPPLGYPSCDQSYCRYAYDFKDAGHFPLISARAGTVISSRDSCANGNTGCTNYIVIQDAVGGAYQVYLHLAHNTIPDRLTSGTYIGRGNYIGDTDDTGYSTSEHVHFMVVRNFWYAGDGYPWGSSVDIRFSDVNLNGGVPRTCYEVARLPIYDNARDCFGNKADPFNPNNDWFRSGNTGASPPTGSHTRPAAGATVVGGTSPMMDVTAQTQDDVRVVRAVLQAKVNGSWREIGPRVSNPSTSGVFDWDVDLCKVGPLHGALEIALKIWDHEGNVVEQLSKRTVQVDHACPPPISALITPTTYNGTAIKLNWSGSASGVPISKFQLQWREGNAVWSADRMLTFGPSVRGTWFTGAPGKNFGFRLRAVDANNQPEAWVANNAAEISHTFPANCQPDAAEPDNTIAQARLVTHGRQYLRNICVNGDVDWYRANVGKYSVLRIRANSIKGGAAVKVSVFNASGSYLLASKKAVGHGSHVLFELPVAGRTSVLIKVESAIPNLSGTDVQYGLTVAGYYSVNLPFIYLK